MRSGSYVGPSAELVLARSHGATMSPHSHVLLSRRRWLQTTGSSLLPLGITCSGLVKAQEKVPAALTPLNRFPRMVQEFYVEQVRAAEAVGLQAQAALKTKADAEGYVRTVREKIAKCFG